VLIFEKGGEKGGVSSGLYYYLSGIDMVLNVMKWEKE